MSIFLECSYQYFKANLLLTVPNLISPLIEIHTKLSVSGSELKINKSPGQRSDSDSWLMLHDVTWPQLIISKECCVPRVSAPLSLPSVSPQLVGCWGAPLFEPGGEPLSREGSITGGGERVNPGLTINGEYLGGRVSAIKYETTGTTTQHHDLGGVS